MRSTQARTPRERLSRRRRCDAPCPRGVRHRFAALRRSVLLSSLCALLVGACSGDASTPHAPVDAEAQADVDAQAQADVDPQAQADVGADASAPSAPLIHQAGLCELADPALSVTPGTDLLKVTLNAPLAVCNDGSPAVFYVRPAPVGGADSDRWVVWLESGGGCNSASACRQRWCGDRVGKMTSRFAPDGIRAGGMSEDRPDNDFAGWNHVVAYYCSSDSWSGRQRTHAIDPSGAIPPYEIYVHGAHIVDALFQSLRAGAESDDGAVTMPRLDDASILLFTGSSAGAGGVRSNADRIGAMLRATNPDVDYRIVVDAGLFLADPHPPELSEADALVQLDFKHEVFVSWRGGATDSSCLEYHQGDERWCSDNSHLMAHHISTPAFIKQDLRDGAPGVYADAQTYSRVLFEWFSGVAAGTFVPEEADVPHGQAGLFAPNCDHHLNINGSNFYEVALTNGAESLTMHDLLSNWVRGAQPVQAIHDPTAGLMSRCP